MSLKSDPKKVSGKAVGMLRKIGARLSSDERPPYELSEHDESFDFSEPTNPNLRIPHSSTDEDKT